MLPPLPRRSVWAYCFAHFTQPYQPSPKGSSGRPAHPIVFVNVSDPLGSGFVTSLAHPGGNITGLAHPSRTSAALANGLQVVKSFRYLLTDPRQSDIL